MSIHMYVCFSSTVLSFSSRFPYMSTGYTEKKLTNWNAINWNEKLSGQNTFSSDKEMNLSTVRASK